jgi:hypothetical protein
MWRLRAMIAWTSSGSSGYSVGSPPQIETVGAPLSSTACRQVARGRRSLSLPVCRSTAQPRQARLQVYSGSSISTKG